MQQLNYHFLDLNVIKTILVIRNQPDKIASHYAQGSLSNYKASQQDFEKHVDTYLSKYYYKLDYAIWIKDSTTQEKYMRYS